MPPYRVEYLCSYRPVWRWDGRETESIEEAARDAVVLAATGRTVRIVDARDRVLWSM